MRYLVPDRDADALKPVKTLSKVDTQRDKTWVAIQKSIYLRPRIHALREDFKSIKLLFHVERLSEQESNLQFHQAKPTDESAYVTKKDTLVASKVCIASLLYGFWRFFPRHACPHKRLVYAVTVPRNRHH